MRQKLWLPCILSIVSLSSCAESRSTADDEPFKPSPRIKVTEELRSAAASSNQLAFDLYARLKTSNENLIFSPAGLTVTLAMAQAGTAGETRREMANVMHVDPEATPTAAGFGELNASLNSSGYGHRIRSANRLWGARQYPFSASFLKQTKRTFGADLASLDFGASEDAAETINDWVSEQTNDRIQNLVSPRSLTKQTRLVLTNAVHFKGRWHHEFWKTKTEDASFHVTADREVRVPLMYAKTDFQYAQLDGVQIIELPYADDADVSMIVILPEEVGLDRLDSTFNTESLGKWLEALARREVELYVPRFKTTSSLELVPPLEALGMRTAFDSKHADFSGMSSEPGLFISQVVQKAYIAVDEEGTEAAAASEMAATAGAMAEEDPPQPAVFRADRPFLYLIRDKRTNAILFLGRLVDPTR